MQRQLQFLLIHLGKGVGEEGFDPEFNESSENVSRQLAWEYEKIAKKNGFYYFDAAGAAEQVKLTDSIQMRKDIKCLRKNIVNSC